MVSFLRGVAAVAATYFYFLIFAQFAFLELLQKVSAKLEPAMAAMACGGLSASLLTARLTRGRDLMPFLRTAFLLCALTAALAPWVNHVWAMVWLSGAVGLALGMLTVTLASALTRLTGPHHFGLKLGCGVGLAYFLCNLPAVFQAPAEHRTWMASAAALFGLAAVIGAAPPCCSPKIHKPRWSRDLFRGVGLATIVCCFLALVWLDSALFYIIQQNPEYKSATWSSVRLLVNGPVHLVFAVLAGVVLDRGWFRPLPMLAYILLCGGALVLISGSEALGLASPLYVAGVSIYSVALVAFPSLWVESEDLVSRSWRAAWLFGIAGWLGSALGIGMARDLARIPLTFLIGAGLVLATASLFRRRGLTQVALLLILGLNACQGRALESHPVARGRQVYIAEGCINCHSQYVRPGTADVLNWGPSRELKPQERLPPLYGNRRMGPDLLNIGNRRSPEWHKLHFIDPQLLTRGSSMPSYAHLFRDGRGPDLISYMMSLGSDTFAERLASQQAWSPDETSKCSAKQAKALFADLCSGCHGSDGKPGAAAAGLSQPVRDLAHDRFLYVSMAARDGDFSLDRVIKFGIPGTNMPGHESLADDEIMGLAALVRELQVGHASQERQ